MPLISVVQWAIGQVPAVKYAAGLIGVAAAAGVVSLILGKTWLAVGAVTLCFVGMVVLFLFARAVALQPERTAPLAMTLLWAVVAVFLAAILLVGSVLTTGKPDRLNELLFPSDPDDSILERLRDHGSNRGAANDALSLVPHLTQTHPNIRRPVIKALLEILDGTDKDERTLRTRALATLVALTDGKLDAAVTDQFRKTDVVGGDFHGTSLVGTDFSEAFVILSNFRGANLTNANLTRMRVRGSDFTGAHLDGSDLRGTDWFNAYGLTIKQLGSMSDHLLHCPSGETGFVSFLDEPYLPFSGYGSTEQSMLRAAWAEYSKPGGLCEIVNLQ